MNVGDRKYHFLSQQALNSGDRSSPCSTFCSMGQVPIPFYKNLKYEVYDILKEWLEFREENILCYLNEEDKKHKLFIDEIYEKVLKNVPQQNKKFVEKQLNELEKNFMDYLSYWNEKYYRNGFVDGVQMATGCFDE